MTQNQVSKILIKNKKWMSSKEIHVFGKINLTRCQRGLRRLYIYGALLRKSVQVKNRRFYLYKWKA